MQGNLPDEWIAVDGLDGLELRGQVAGRRVSGFAQRSLAAPTAGRRTLLAALHSNDQSQLKLHSRALLPQIQTLHRCETARPPGDGSASSGLATNWRPPTV